MESASGRYSITYNGEIYNYRELRTELRAEGYVFGTESDTEVLVAGLDLWGLERLLPRLDGTGNLVGQVVEILEYVTSAS